MSFSAEWLKLREPFGLRDRAHDAIEDGALGLRRRGEGLTHDVEDQGVRDEVALVVE